jgi:hypothetical protein
LKYLFVIFDYFYFLIFRGNKISKNGVNRIIKHIKNKEFIKVDLSDQDYEEKCEIFWDDGKKI